MVKSCLNVLFPQTELCAMDFEFKRALLQGKLSFLWIDNFFKQRTMH